VCVCVRACVCLCVCVCVFYLHCLLSVVATCKGEVHVSVFNEFDAVIILMLTGNLKLENLET
jgi:hypothetical protein